MFSQPYFGTAHQGTRLVAYSTTQDRDACGLATITHFTAMQNFNAKSTEEWRYEDYKVDRTTRKLFRQPESFTEVRRDGLFGQGFFPSKSSLFPNTSSKSQTTIYKEKETQTDNEEKTWSSPQEKQPVFNIKCQNAFFNTHSGGLGFSQPLCKDAQKPKLSQSATSSIRVEPSSLFSQHSKSISQIQRLAGGFSSMRLQNPSESILGFGSSKRVSSSDLNPSSLDPYSFGSSQPYTSLNLLPETLGKTIPGSSLFGSSQPNTVSNQGPSLFGSRSTPSSSVFSKPNTSSSSLYPSAVQESSLFGSVSNSNPGFVPPSGSSRSTPSSTALLGLSRPSESLFGSSKAPNSNAFTQGLFSSSQPDTNSNPLGSQDSNLPSSSQRLGTPEPAKSPSSEDSDSKS